MPRDNSGICAAANAGRERRIRERPAHRPAEPLRLARGFECTRAFLRVRRFGQSAIPGRRSIALIEECASVHYIESEQQIAAAATLPSVHSNIRAWY